MGLELSQCKDSSRYETYMIEGPQRGPAKCMSYKHLNCERSITRAWNFARKQTWAEKAFTPIFKNASGVDFHKATIEDYHQIHFCGGPKDVQCELPPCTCSNPPCDFCGPDLVKKTTTRHPDKRKGPSQRVNLQSGVREMIGYKAGSSPSWVGKGWCRALRPSSSWSLNGGCSAPNLDISVLTYNLFWWMLFGKRGGANRMAGKLVERNGPWDFMGFQECDNAHRIVDDSMPAEHRCTKDRAGTDNPWTRHGCTHGIYNGTNAVANAWDKGTWRALTVGFRDVTEDGRAQYYGRRSLVWGRFEHKETHKKVFFANHHGALPVGGGGGGFCGGEATAYNILREIGENSQRGDAIILVGDFNAVRSSRLLNTLAGHMTLNFQGKSFGGVDNIYSNECAQLVSKRNLGNGGSDHDALGATFRI